MEKTFEQMGKMERSASGRKTDMVVLRVKKGDAALVLFNKVLITSLDQLT
jgi:hypothetical protein